MRGLHIWEREVIRWGLILILLAMAPTDPIWTLAVVTPGVVLILVLVARLPVKTSILLRRATRLLDQLARRSEADLARRAKAALREIREG